MSEQGCGYSLTEKGRDAQGIPALAQPTPGPWRLTGEMDRIHGGEVIRPSRGDGVDSPVAVVCDFNRFDRDAEREANARLIAASPDLLATLQNIQDGLPACEDDKFAAWLSGVCQNAIAKAEGREP